MLDQSLVNFLKLGILTIFVKPNFKTMNTNTSNYFRLNTGDKLQGSYVLKEINMAFVFQVNCPGCFIYGIPMVNTLYNTYQKDVGFLGVSTAFEDFDKNTAANTRLLLEEQQFVGETQKYFAAQGITQYSPQIQFPVFFDKMSTPEKFLNATNLEIIQQKLRIFATVQPDEQEAIKQRLVTHYQQFPHIAHTFHLNQLPGTPTLIIYNQQQEIIKQWFGQQSLAMVATQLDALLEKQVTQKL